VDLHYGNSGVGKVVSWLLNDNTETIDVIIPGKEFHWFGYWHQRADERHGIPPAR